MRRTLVVLAVAAVAVAACGGVDEISEGIAERALESQGEGDVDVEFSTDDDEFSASVETDEGSFALGGAAEVPEGLDMPIPDGGNVTASGTEGSSIFVSIIYPGDRYDEIVATYDSWTASTGDEWQTANASLDVGGEEQRSATWSTGSTAIVVTTCPDIASGGTSLDAVCVTINQGS